MTRSFLGLALLFYTGCTGEKEPTPEAGYAHADEARMARLSDPLSTSTGEAGGALLLTVSHPLHAEIVDVRSSLLGVDPRIAEAVKWNAPSYRTTEFFATFHLRSTDSVRMVLHTGAKRRANPATLDIPDPSGLLQ